MKALLLSLTLASFLAPASAQVQCGAPGVTVNVTPQVAQVGVPFSVLLFNGSSSLIQLPTSCTISSVSAGGGCTGPPVFSPLCLQVITPIQPNGFKSMSWTQTDDFGQQVLPGVYSIEVKYWDASFSQLHSCCVDVTVVPAAPGTQYCFGGGHFGELCPCSNYGASFAGEGGCANSTGEGAELSATGAATIGADTVVLEVARCNSNTPGLFFSGTTTLSAPFFGDGLRCAGGTVHRLGVVTTTPAGTAATPWQLSVKEGLQPGDLRHYQYWYRDISGPCGGLFNLTNGYTIQW